MTAVIHSFGVFELFILLFENELFVLNFPRRPEKINKKRSNSTVSKYEKMSKRQTKIYDLQHRKQKTRQHQPHKKNLG